MDTPSTAGSGSGHTLSSAVVRFAGDSGDGMQITGAQFTSTSALLGNDLATFPDFPAEIRAPAGTLYGVSGFQVHFASDTVFTPGDRPDALVAMNPAALKTNLAALEPGSLLVVNSGAFSRGNLAKAGYTANPLEDGSLSAYNLISVDISKQTLASVAETGLSTKEANRCKNFWTLGLMYWLYTRPLETTEKWLAAKFKKRPELVDANSRALRAGYAFGETLELSHERVIVPRASVQAGTYRNVSGNQATAWGLVAAAQLSGRGVVLGSYPITPASDVLHELSKHKAFDVATFQAEDEIAAVCAAIGASYSGKLGVTSTSGPGMALKAEGIGLAVATELPLVVLNVQRAGPSTGMPTKTEQADLLQALYGRNGEAPLCVLAPATPGECFFVALDAARIAITHMTPVVILTDGYLANGAEPWQIPDVASLEPFPAPRDIPTEGFHPFLRDPDTLARPWAAPGMPGLAHRIGGIERDYDSGNISYDPKNHQRMSDARAEKIRRIADRMPAACVEEGDETGDLVVVGWGSTYGAIREGVRRCRARGLSVSHVHIRSMNPLPRGLAETLKGFKKVVVPEMNMGQLVKVLRSDLLISAESFPKIEGQPFRIEEIEACIKSALNPEGQS